MFQEAFNCLYIPWPSPYRIPLCSRHAQLWSLKSAGWPPFVLDSDPRRAPEYLWATTERLNYLWPTFKFVFGLCSLQTSCTTICISYPDGYIVGIIWLALAFSFLWGRKTLLSLTSAWCFSAVDVNLPFVPVAECTWLGMLLWDPS